MTQVGAAATFEAVEGPRSRVVGPLDFATVTRLLRAGAHEIGAGHAEVIDLSGVTASDSSGLALLIEWMSIAKAANRPLRYEGMPVQLHQLARLSDVEALLIAS